MKEAIVKGETGAVKIFFHVEIRLKWRACVYGEAAGRRRRVRLDLNEYDIIKTVIDPYLDDEGLIYRGVTIKKDGIANIRITATKESVRDRFQELLSKKYTRSDRHATPYKLRQYHNSELHLFTLFRDYTPYFFGVYPNSPERKIISKTLSKIEKLKVKKIELVGKEDSKEYKKVSSKLDDQVARFAYLLGSFLRGFIEGGLKCTPMSRQ